jgi:YfiH family protein
LNSKWYHESARGIIAEVRNVPLPILRSPLLEANRFAHAFPTREVVDADLFGALGTRAIVQVTQVHGAIAALGRGATRKDSADALIGRSGEEAVGVRVADCVPVLVADAASGDVAAIHAGWRGVVAGVIGAGVQLLGGRDVVAAIGPCIGPCCFEVGAEVADQVGFVVRRVGDKAFVDLRAAVRAQLRTLGLPDARIDDVAGCTRHELRFHSFRRDGKESGRMLAAIAPRASR